MGPLKSWSPPGKLFGPTLPALVPLLRRDRALDLTDAQTELLVRMSAAVIDCGLPAIRAGDAFPGRCHTKPGFPLKSGGFRTTTSTSRE